MLLWMGTGLVCWWLVGRNGNYRKSLIVLASSSVVWPLVLGAVGSFLSSPPKGEEKSLTFVEGESALRTPVAIEGLQEDEFFFPDSVSKGRDSYLLLTGGGFPKPPPSGQPFYVLEDRYSDFTEVVDIEKVWTQLRKKVPAHESWIESEPAGAIRPSRRRFSEVDLDSQDLIMGGGIYRVKPIPAISLSDPGVRALGSGLRLLEVEASSAHAIDVSLRLDLDVLGAEAGTKRGTSNPPPEVWGILFHPESGTAYGTVGGRINKGSSGPRDLLIKRHNLLLRFELPRLETALLGVSPESILAGSKLYLFYFEKVESAQASFAKAAS